MVQMIHLMTAMVALTGTASAWTFNTCDSANPGLGHCTQKSGSNAVSHLGRPGRTGGHGGSSGAGSGAGSAAKGAAKAAGEGALNEAGGQLYNSIFGSSAPASSTRFAYDSGGGSDNGYWHSHDVDGLYVSPAGYFHPNAGLNILIVSSKDGSATAWDSYVPCCLPDGVGTGIQDLMAYKSS